MQQQGVAKNTTFLTSALVFQKALTFLYYIFLARLVGPADVGKFVFAMSFTTMFTIFVDLGLSQVLTREIARERDKAQKYLANVLSVKIILALLATALVIIVINLLNYPLLTKQMVYLATIVMVVDSFQLVFYAVFRGFQNLKYESIGMSTGQILIFVTGLIGLKLGAPLHILVIAVLTGSLFQFFWSLFLIGKKLKIKIGFSLEKSVLKYLLAIAAPFALYGVFVKIYSYLDAVLLSKLAGDAYVGWYGIAYKATFALQFLPAAFAAAIFPAMSAHFVADKEKLARVFERSMFYLMIIALPISVGLATLADKIIPQLYGQSFIGSVLPLQILISGLLFIFLNYPVGNLLNACNKQKTNTMVMGITTVISVILNIILIPRYQAVGAAITSLASGALLFFLGLYFVRQVTKYNGNFLILSFIKTIISAGLMGVMIIYLKPTVNWLFLIPLAGICYFVLMFSLKGLTIKDIVSVKESVFKKV